MLSDTDEVHNTNPTVRPVEVERSPSGSCGFKLTRGKWDPYPWVSSVDPGTAAYWAGIKPGDCILEVNGEDIVGRRISDVAEIVKSRPGQVSLLLWNAGVDPQCTPEAVCCGPMPVNLQRLSACMSSILQVLECPVCLDTISPPTYQCENGHLICMRCRTKSERCPVCRLRLGRGRSLLSDQVYNALADAFNLRSEVTTLRIQQIFKSNCAKSIKQVPEIKITQPSSTANKFLARFIGKSSSDENLNSMATSTKPHQSNLITIDTNLRSKSLSNHDMTVDSPVVSRTNLNEENQRSSSHHGSYESLRNGGDDGQYHCPFSIRCKAVLKGGLCHFIEHFQSDHDGPLIQYFRPGFKIPLRSMMTKEQLCYVVHNNKNVFFVKFERIDGHSENVLLWTWLLSADKRAAKQYEVQVRVHNEGLDEDIISVSNVVYSLSSASYHDIKNSKRGVILNARTLMKTAHVSADDTLADTKDDIVLDINILFSDND